jgi:methylated-DNA-[protein]-cysteine S-methyltransferase
MHAEHMNSFDMKIVLSELNFALGAMLLATDERGRVRALEFSERRARLYRNLREHCGTDAVVTGPAPAAVADALQRYFDGELHALNGIEVATAGTQQQESAWAALRGVPVRTTSTYASIGKAMGIEGWRAAVDAGAAIGANPIAIIVPCHRVLGANGDLKGYAWGLPRKRWLLEHETAIHAMPTPAQLLTLF